MLAQVVLMLAILLVFVGMIMVLLDAFNESFIWGLLVLLFPPVFLPIYSFVKWNKSQARNGFAMTLVGLVMAGVGIYGGGLQGLPFMKDQEIVGKLPTAVPKDEPLPNEEEAAKVKLEDEDDESYDPILSSDKDRFTSKDIEPLAPQEDKTVKVVGKVKPTKINIPIESIGSAMGADIEITLKDGTKHVGTVVRSTEESVSIEQQASGGMVSFEYELDKIQSVLRISKPKKVVTPPVVEIKETVTPPVTEPIETMVAPQNTPAVTPDSAPKVVPETTPEAIPELNEEEVVAPAASQPNDEVVPPVMESEKSN